jgi:hypothetical protein
MAVSLLNIHKSIRCSGSSNIAWNLAMLVPSTDSAHFRQFKENNKDALRSYKDGDMQREMTDQV